MDDKFTFNNLNRSFSTPEIFLSPRSIRRKIYVEEVVLSEYEPPLLRQFSCQEILNGKGKSTQYFSLFSLFVM